MNTRPNQWWEKKKCTYIGIIAVCYLSSLMNLIIDGGGSGGGSSGQEEKTITTADQYNGGKK